ncbi:hypothetical protein DBV05_g5254 [Lasiodiplodia theobromae]|uniref:BTB domain-containing protein n=1 Tax=Lasiodiplodia theobromae TaxID=45133 RepID=A0A5N5DE56_9PEZI|nr:hypothetical protein DBV05_g5254 [Lasiodiplodia theobromae]
MTPPEKHTGHPGTSVTSKRSSESEPLPAKTLKDSSFPKFLDGDVTITLHDISFQLHSKKLRESCDYFAEFDELPKRFILGSSDVIKPVEPEPVASEAFDSEPVASKAFEAETVVSEAFDPESVEFEAFEAETVASEAFDPESVASEAFDPESVASEAFEAETVASEAFDPEPVEPKPEPKLEPKPILKRTQDANENIFRLLYKRPLACSTPQCLLDTSILVGCYGCVGVNKVRDPLALATHRVCAGGELYRKSPWGLLTLAFDIHEESIFSVAFEHVVGRGEDIPERLPAKVAELVARYTAKLRDEIEECWELATTRCSSTNDSIPDTLAASMMGGYLCKKVAYSSKTALTPDVYDNLLYISRMKDVGPIMESKAALLKGVDCVDESMDEAQKLAAYMSNYFDDEEDNWGPALRAADKGLKMGMNRRSVKNSLQKKLREVQDALRPLFQGDKGVGYFTFMRFKDSFPW